MRVPQGAIGNLPFAGQQKPIRYARGLGRVVNLRIEGYQITSPHLVRLHPRETRSIIQREASLDLPGILSKPLDVRGIIRVGDIPALLTVSLVVLAEDVAELVPGGQAIRGVRN